MPLLVQYDYGTLSAYQASTKNEGVLFFTEDTHQLFKGAHEMTKSAKFVDALPPVESGEYGAIYIVTPTNLAYVCSGAGYVQITKAYTSELSDVSSDDEVPTAKSVVEYVDAYTKTERVVQQIPSDTDLVLPKLPGSGKEYLFTDGSIKSIAVESIAETVSEDYWALLVFQKSTLVDSIESILNTDEIVLMTKDLDISEYAIIHILLTYDGMNVCAFVAGY